MINVKFYVYINDQSNKPLIHSIEEAKSYAVRHTAYNAALRIECYYLSSQISKYNFDYRAMKWVEEIVINSHDLYRKMK